MTPLTNFIKNLHNVCPDYSHARKLLDDSKESDEEQRTIQFLPCEELSVGPIVPKMIQNCVLKVVFFSFSVLTNFLLHQQTLTGTFQSTQS